MNHGDGNFIGKISAVKSPGLPKHWYPPRSGCMVFGRHSIVGSCLAFCPLSVCAADSLLPGQVREQPLQEVPLPKPKQFTIFVFSTWGSQRTSLGIKLGWVGGMFDCFEDIGFSFIVSIFFKMRFSMALKGVGSDLMPFLPSGTIRVPVALRR